MTSTENNILNRAEFEIFLMLYASHVDYVYTEEEENYIRSISDPKTYEKIFELFKNTTDYSCLKIILKNKEAHFDNEREKNYYFNLLKKIFEVDGNYSRIEKSFIIFFEKLLETEKI